MTSTLVAEHAAVAVAELAERIGVSAGCDVVDVPRLQERLARTPRLLDRLLCEREITDARRGGVRPGSIVEARRIAARVAAKEAAYKALGIPGLSFRDVEVVTTSTGAPELHVHGRPANAALSLSHDGDVAMAVVVATPAARRPNPVDLHAY